LPTQEKSPKSLFENMEGLKMHLESKHKESFDKYEKDYTEI